MPSTLRRPIVLAILLVWLLTACGGGAAPDIPPTEAAALPSDTVAPTATSTPQPTETHTAAPPTETPTPVPPTKTPRPTATHTPGPGDVVYAPIYETDWKRWDNFYFGDSPDYSLEPDNQFLNFDIQGEDTYVYAVYGGGFDEADVQLDVDVTVVAGPNRNNLSILCRYSDLGWYEFNVLSGGLWTIYKYDESSGYRELASGGSTAIHMGQEENHLTAVCVGNTLTMYINDVEVGSAKDGAFIEGSFGMSASTFDIGKLNVRFRDFTVRLADPEAGLGAAVAPTVPPGFGSGGDDTAWDGFLSVPLPGETIANEALQFKTLISLGVLAADSIPATCQDIRITHTAVVQIVKPFVFNAEQSLTEGEWLEQWTLSACGVVSSYQVRYAADGTGGVTSAVSRLP